MQCLESSGAAVFLWVTAALVQSRCALAHYLAKYGKQMQRRQLHLSEWNYWRLSSVWNGCARVAFLHEPVYLISALSMELVVPQHRLSFVVIYVSQIAQGRQLDDEMEECKKEKYINNATIATSSRWPRTRTLTTNYHTKIIIIEVNGHNIVNYKA